MRGLGAVGRGEVRGRAWGPTSGGEETGIANPVWGAFGFWSFLEKQKLQKLPKKEGLNYKNRIVGCYSLVLH
jgi:hypothetical protein